MTYLTDFFTDLATAYRSHFGGTQSVTPLEIFDGMMSQVENGQGGSNDAYPVLNLDYIDSDDPLRYDKLMERGVLPSNSGLGFAKNSRFYGPVMSSPRQYLNSSVGVYWYGWYSLSPGYSVDGGTIEKMCNTIPNCALTSNQLSSIDPNAYGQVFCYEPSASTVSSMCYYQHGYPIAPALYALILPGCTLMSLQYFACRDLYVPMLSGSAQSSGWIKDVTARNIWLHKLSCVPRLRNYYTFSVYSNYLENIYVPKYLVDGFMTASYWSYYSSFFKGI